MRSQDDGRGLYAELNSAGAEKLKAARRTHHEGVRKFFLDHLTTTDQIVLADIRPGSDSRYPTPRC